MKKIISVILVMTMIIVMFSGCGNSTEEGTLAVALQTTAQGVPAYIAETEGYTETEGVKTISAVYATGVAQLEALGADSWDVACIGAPPAMTANIAYDAQIIAIVLNESSTELFVRSDSDIINNTEKIDGIMGTVEAWKGKNILLPLNTTSHYIILSALSSLGLSSNDVNLINMDVGQAYTAFKSGQADVVCIWDPYSFRAEEEGWISVMYGPDTDAVCPCMLVASKKAIEEKPEEIKAWLRAYFDVVESESFNDKKMADVTYTFFNNNDITISEDESVKFAERKDFFTLAESYESFFNVGDDGMTEAERNMYRIAEFFYEQGSYTEEDYNKVTNGDLFYTKFIEELYNESK